MRNDGPVLDSSAVIALLWDEPGAEQVEAALAHATSTGASCAISTVNWGEVLYIAAQREGRRAVPKAIEKIDGLPIALVDADRDLTLRAAMLKASGRLDYADAFCAALAQTLGVPVLTRDHDFESLERDGALEVQLIR